MIEALKKIAIVVLIVAVNLCAGLTMFEIIAPQSKGGKICALIVWLGGNFLAFLWKGTPIPTAAVRAARAAKKLGPALLVFFAAAISACTAAQWKALGVSLAQCALGAVPPSITSLTEQTTRSLLDQPGAPSWEDWGKNLGTSVGVDAAKCAVSGAMHWIGTMIPKGSSPSPQIMRALSRGQDWLDAHGGAK